jgi:hypothetical protein
MDAIFYGEARQPVSANCSAKDDNESAQRDKIKRDGRPLAGLIKQCQSERLSQRKNIRV